MSTAIVPLLLARDAPVMFGDGDRWLQWACLMCLGSIILFAAAFYLDLRKEAKRTEALRRVAEELRFDFSHKYDRGVLNAMLQRSFYLFSRGSNKRAYNILRGAAGGLEVVTFDYDYTTGSGKTYRQTAAVFCRSGPALPAFSLEAISFWDKIDVLPGYQRITLSRYPYFFSFRYLLLVPDGVDRRGWFTEEVVCYYEVNKRLSTESRGDWLVIYSRGKRVKPNEVRPFLEQGFEALALFNPPGVQESRPEASVG